MQLIIEKSAYFDVEKISILKTYVTRIIKNDDNNGVIELDLSYLNSNSEECFNTINLDYELDLNDYKIIDVKVLSTKIYVIESNGVNIDYKIEVEYEKFDDEVIEMIDDTIVIPEENDEEIISFEEGIEKIKEDISKDYENKLIDSLNRNENKQIKIISSKDNRSELEFVNFFNFEERGYHLIKTLYCPNEEVLNDIAKKYQIEFNTLLRGYDRDNKKVTFRINE